MCSTVTELRDIRKQLILAMLSDDEILVAWLKAILKTYSQ